MPPLRPTLRSYPQFAHNQAVFLFIRILKHQSIRASANFEIVQKISAIVSNLYKKKKMNSCQETLNRNAGCIGIARVVMELFGLKVIHILCTPRIYWRTSINGAIISAVGFCHPKAIQENTPMA